LTKISTKQFKIKSKLLIQPKKQNKRAIIVQGLTPWLVSSTMLLTPLWIFFGAWWTTSGQFHGDFRPCTTHQKGTFRIWKCTTKDNAKETVYMNELKAV